MLDKATYCDTCVGVLIGAKRGPGQTFLNYLCFGSLVFQEALLACIPTCSRKILKTSTEFLMSGTHQESHHFAQAKKKPLGMVKRKENFSFAT